MGEIMPAHADSIEQSDLRQATMRYIESLPSSHRALLQVIAEEYQRPPYALVAGAIEQLIVDWTRAAVPQEPCRSTVLHQRTA
jgi:hypothetical protein